MSGPLFLGISGVVFGMLGYIWMQGRFDPRGHAFTAGRCVHDVAVGISRYLRLH